VTPAQLKAFAAVVRLGSVKEAAGELGVSESAVSLHVAQLRKEFDDPLFNRTGSGLAFTPGGLRLASRAAEILGLQDQTVREVSQAGRGRRMLRLATSTLFAEHAAPGLIQLFASRAKDLDVELSVRGLDEAGSLLLSRTVDVAIGPPPPSLPDTVMAKPFLNYKVIVVAGPGHPLAGVDVGRGQLRDQTYFLGPSAAGHAGAVPQMLRTLGVPEANQRIFQSDAAALEETRRSDGISLAVQFTVGAELAKGRLVQVGDASTCTTGTWSAMTLRPPSLVQAAEELLRFITTPRATQAMIRGSGATIGHFRPSVHVTLWS
jgi:DNA-binding transcriptional LysR family regulator